MPTQAPAPAPLWRWLFLALLALYLATAGGHFYASDDVQKLHMLEAYFRTGGVAIADGWVKGADGLRYAWFPLGASLVMLPGYLLGSLLAGWLPTLPASYAVRFCVSLENAVVSAALVTAVAMAAHALGASRRRAVMAALALGLGTLVWPYAKTAWSEPIATLCVFGGLMALYQAAGGLQREARWLGLAGACLALAAFIRLELVLASAGGLAWYLWESRGRPRPLRGLVAFVLPYGLVAAASLGYDALRYGALFTFPSYSLPQQQALLQEGRFGRSLVNVFQYTLSPNQGLVWYSPAAALGLLGLGRFRREQPRALALGLVALGPLALFYVIGWGSSSWAWGLRYTYLFLPFLVLPLAWLRLTGPRLAWLGLALAVQLLAVLHNPLSLFERELATHPGLTIQRLMTEPAHAPLKLALAATPATLASGAALLGGELALTGDMRAQREHLPDLWVFLLRLAGVPGSAIGAALALLVALLALACVRLARALKQEPAHGA